METLHPDAICKYLYKEYKKPDNWLLDIYNRQKELQDFICSKRNGLQIPNNNINPEHIYESLYHYTCMMMELKEMKESPNAEEEAFEYIDVLFFLCNIGIYAGVKEASYIDIKEKSNFNILESFQNTLLEFLDSLPFKKWKTYKNEAYIAENFKLEKYNEALNYWVAYGLYQKNYTAEKIYNLYRSKLEENQNRQTNKSKGYI